MLRLALAFALALRSARGESCRAERWTWNYKGEPGVFHASSALDVLHKWPLDSTTPVVRLMNVTASDGPTARPDECAPLNFWIRSYGSDIHVVLGIFSRVEYEPLSRIGDRVGSVLDAGANVGMASLWFALKFPSARIISLEPEADNFRLLKLNTKPFRDRLSAVNAALGGEDGYVATTTVGARTQDPSGWAIRVQRAVEGSSGAVRSLSIPSLERHFHTTFDVIKVDIEGYESQLLFNDDAREFFARAKVVVFELHEDLAPGIEAQFRRVFAGDQWRLVHHGEYDYAFATRAFPNH